MEESHKHLGITEQWGAFVATLHEVCDELGLPKQEVDDVTAVSVDGDGLHTRRRRAAPPNPGHPPPNGNSLYARLGGVYLSPLCDRLADALLSERTVQIPLDERR